jgi:hypothetical protein
MTTLITSQVDGTALTASTTPTSIIPPAAIYTLPNNFFYIGKQLRIRAMGRISNVITTPGTLIFSVRLGTGPVIAATSDALGLNIVAKTNVHWEVDWLLTCRAIGGGTGANLMHNGRFISESVIGSVTVATGTIGTLPLVAAAPAVGTGFDSTAAQKVDFFATWSINNANSILVHQYALDDLN